MRATTRVIVVLEVDTGALFRARILDVKIGEIRLTEVE